MNLSESTARDPRPKSAVGPEAGVEARVSELLFEWRAQDEGNSVLPTQSQEDPPTQVPGHRSGGGLMSVLRSLASGRRPPLP